MQEGRLWGWGIDAYGVCSTIHCLLFGDYMQVEKTINAEGMLHVLRHAYELEVVTVSPCRMDSLRLAISM